MTIGAPVIRQEMAAWVALGGGNSGIVGDPNHTSGFHLGANRVPASDYSRRRDPNGSDGPYVSWDYACAGDFSHRNDETLRAMHRSVLSGLMAGRYPMVCEFIGKPWPDQPVYYWARWNGVRELRRYTGAGHDHWSHISWYRSRVDEPANLWKEADMPLTPDDIKRAWKSDYLRVPITNRDGTPRSAEAIEDNPFWTAETYLNEIYENVSRNQGKIDAIELTDPVALAEALAGNDTAIDKIATAVASRIGMLPTAGEIARATADELRTRMEE